MGCKNKENCGNLRKFFRSNLRIRRIRPRSVPGHFSHEPREIICCVSIHHLHAEASLRRLRAIAFICHNRRKDAVAEQAKNTILVVDDEDAIRDVLREELVSAGYEVLLAATGEEAMEILPRHKVDLAILDIRLPGVDGIEVLKFITRGYRKTRVIMLTGHSDLKYAMEAREFGARDFIDKPFVIADLIGAVNDALRK